VRGFLTDEIRTRGERVGCRLQCLDGETATLAHVGLASSHRVGRYRVDVDAVDAMVDRALVLDEATDVYIVDEIGKMECLSRRFVTAVGALLDSGRPVVASVAQLGGGFPAAVRARPDATLLELTWKNRDEIPGRIAEWLNAVMTSHH